MPQSLYSCSCHPFKDWKEHDYFSKQKIEPGTIVKDRCTGEFAITFSKAKFNGYYRIDVFPSDCPRCITSVHVSNLIQFSDFSEVDKKKALKLKPKNFINSLRLWEDINKRDY